MPPMCWGPYETGRYASLIRLKASWRRMLVCQPPVSDVKYQFVGDGNYEYEFPDRSLEGF